MRSAVNRNVAMRRIPAIITKFCMKRTDVRGEGKTLILNPSPANVENMVSSE